jgi:hypothetical protein
VDPPVYDFGPVAPASYTVKAYAKGRLPTPGEQAVMITDSDNGVDFNFTAAAVDANEPNDDPAVDPLPILPGDGTPSQLMSVDGELGPDYADWFQFDALKDQMILVEATRGQEFWPPVDMLVYLPDGVNNIPGQTRYEPGPGQQSCIIRAPADGTYYLRVGGGPVEYKISLRVQDQ